MPDDTPTGGVSVGNGAVSAAETALEQAFLFGADELPQRPDLIEMVKVSAYRHTGKIVGKDLELCRMVVADLLSGLLSYRDIAKKYRVSRSSIHAMVGILRERGELEPLATRVRGLLGDMIEMGLEEMIAGIQNGRIAPSQLPIPIAAMIDKKAQLDAGIVPGTDRTEREITAADLRAEWERIRAGAKLEITVQAQPIDSQSSAQPAQLPAPQGADTQ